MNTPGEEVVVGQFLQKLDLSDFGLLLFCRDYRILKGFSQPHLYNPLGRDLNLFTRCRVETHPCLSTRDDRLANSRESEGSGFLGLGDRQRYDLFNDRSGHLLRDVKLASKMGHNLGLGERLLSISIRHFWHLLENLFENLIGPRVVLVESVARTPEESYGN